MLKVNGLKHFVLLSSFYQFCTCKYIAVLQFMTTSSKYNKFDTKLLNLFQSTACRSNHEMNYELNINSLNDFAM